MVLILQLLASGGGLHLEQAGQGQLLSRVHVLGGAVQGPTHLLGPREAPAQREVLPQREPFVVVLRHQDPPQIRVPGEVHAVHVVDFTLEPVRGRPDVRAARYGQVGPWELSQDPQHTPVHGRPELVPDLDDRATTRVGAHDVEKEVEGLIGVRPQELEDLVQLLGTYRGNRRPDRVDMHAAEGTAESGTERLDRLVLFGIRRRRRSEHQVGDTLHCG